MQKKSKIKKKKPSTASESKLIGHSVCTSQGKKSFWLSGVSYAVANQRQA